MKISYKWLKELIEITESPEEIGILLTATGLEVESIEEVESIKGGLKGVVIGRVLTCEKHPEADRLKLTTVDVGLEQPLSIVCGASNVAAGQTVIVATIGATLYPVGSEDAIVIKKSKIRGALSEGMICAEDEIGIGSSHDGIMVLETTLPSGTPAAEYFNITSDYLIEIGLTPNRADAASHYGVARDLKAVLNRDIQLPSVSDFKVDNTDLSFEVVVDHLEAAPRYAGLTISGLEVKDSPEWLKQRLQTIGVRSINAVVDITNYICHELGQPMHAFDASKVDGNKIWVKTVEAGTSFITLDGEERKLSDSDLMICNATAPMCIAGVFGGLTSGVSTETTSIFLESAYFSPISVRRTAQRFALKTDSSFRFERGTDPNMPVFALKRAAMLIQEICGGSISSEITDIYPTPIADFEVQVSYKNIDRLIGKQIGKEKILTILKSLDIRITSETETGFLAIVPPYRVDVQREADIIEEILRIYGFGQVELSEGLSSEFLSDFPVNDPEKLRMKISYLLAGNGYNEMINNSLTKPALQAQIADSVEGEPVQILNHLSEDLSVMRQVLLFSGLEVVAYNSNRRQRDLKLFEFGKTYTRIDGKYKEKEKLAVFLSGNIEDENWIAKSQEVTFHDLATTVSQILSAMKITQVDKTNADPNIFQYGLTLSRKGKPFVSFGLIKSSFLKSADVKGKVFFADFDWEFILKQYDSSVQFKEVSKFPEVRRDLSLVVEKQVTFEEIRQLAFKTEKQLLRNVNIFDVYEGANLEGKKSYSISFTLQDDQQTLTDKTIDKTMQRLIANYERELGAVIRK
jgi:phenylalanyl-tRNA synthetase beta chain